MYQYSLLIPGEKALVDGANTLGIEVTDPVAAELCALGNVDPQHNRRTSLGTPPAAIEACLTHDLPPAGSRLVTSRPDLDSVGGMAVLCLRAEGTEIGASTQRRIRDIATIDRFDRGCWPGARPMPDSALDILADGFGVELGALAAVVSDPRLPLGARVAKMRAWLVDGTVPSGQAEASRQRAERLFASLTAGATRLETHCDGRVGVAISFEHGALMLAYRIAPVVVALNPAWRFLTGQGRKYTIARWSVADANLDRAVSILTPRESGWGGQKGIKGSPQDRPSALELETVIAATAAALPNIKGSSTS